MVTIREMPPLASQPEWLAAIRRGLTSLTVTGPSPMLEGMYREALSAVAHRPSQQERETSLNQASLASSVEEMYSLVRAAISASRPV
jgi:hypothetical protein